MITKSKAFTTSDGNQYVTIKPEQRAELQRLLTAAVHDDAVNVVLQVLFENLDAVKAILRVAGRKARKTRAQSE